MATASRLKSQTNETDIVAWARDFVVELRGAQSDPIAWRGRPTPSSSN